MLFRQGDFAQMPTIETPRLTLRRMQMRDDQDIFAYSSDPEVARYVQWRAYTSIHDARDYIRYMQRQYRNDLPASWAVVEKASGRVIGTAGYSWINRDHNSAEIGYSLGRAYWGRGYMSEALAVILRHGFETLRLHRIEAQHDVRNPASGRVMEKNGMRLEGTLRGRLYNKGEYVDVRLYAVLAEDWQRLQRGLQG